MTATKHPVPKICMHCQKPFVARKYTTKFCSLRCAQLAYKDKERQERLAKHKTSQGSIAAPRRSGDPKGKPATDIKTMNVHLRELIDIEMLMFLTGIKERTIYRLIKTPGFPMIKIGKLLRFHRTTTITFITEKFSTHERNT